MLMPQVMTLFQIPRVPSKAPCFSSRCRSVGEFPKRGPQPPLWSFEGEVQEGETEIPLQCLSLTGRGRFSLQERNGGASAQPSSWLSPTLRGCPLPLLKIPTRRCFRLAHLASWLHTVPVVNGVIPPPALDVMPPKMLARTAGFFHFFTSIYTIYIPYMYH